MAIHIDPTILTGFAKEVQPALAKIREGVDSFLRDNSQHDALEDAYQCMQSVKDAAEMLGLPILSQLTLYLEEMVEDVATEPAALPVDRSAHLRTAVEQLHAYLQRSLSGEAPVTAPVVDIVRAFRRFKHLPDSDDQAAVRALLGEDIDLPAVSSPAPSAPDGDALDDASDDLIEGFLLEAEDCLNAVGRVLSQVGSAPNQRECVQQVRRNIHTFKGAAGVVGFRTASQIAHRMEDLLDDLYAGSRTVTPAIKDLLLQTFDALDEFVRARGQVPTLEQTAQALARAYDQVMAPPAPSTPAVVTPAPAPAVAASTASATQDETSDELMDGFLLEAEEYLNTIGRTLPEVETAPDQRECLQRVRRSVHTFKGAAGVVGFRTASQVAHRMEDLLDELHAGQRSLTPQVTDLLFATFNALDEFVRARGQLPAFADTAATLQRAYATVLEAGAEAGSPPAEVVPATPAVLAPAPVPVAALTPSTVEASEPAIPSVTQLADVLRVPLDRVDELVRLISELVISRSAYEQHLGRLTHQVDELRLSIERLQRTSTTVETQYEVRALTGGQGLFTPLNLINRAATPVNNTREFDALEFDRYSEFTLVSRELTETTADISALGQEFNDVVGDFDGYLTRQSRLTSEIQDKLMRLRMVPLATLATRLHRAVRVTARERGKDAVLLLEGEDVEFDKTMLEDMAEPLLHLLRNAVDHGIEAADVRHKAGKPAQGHIRLRAFREGTQVVLQMRDDGAGLQPARLRASAIRGGFLSEAEAAQCPDEQLYALIFKPGFSTAPEVSEISGRGVGMDVVHAIVSRLKGHITIDSTPGQGVTFTMRLPLTLAITRVLLVKAHSETLAIPLADVTQIVRVEPKALEQVSGVSVVRIDKQVLPVVRLGERLRLPQAAENTGRLLPIVVVQAGETQVAFVVDELIGGREVVGKTLGSHLRRVHGVIGSTLLGDGSVVLILNPAELARDEQMQVSTARKPAAKPRRMRAQEVLEILVVDDSFSVRRVVSNLIKSAGWHPTLAKDGLEALEIVQSAPTPPDLILLDVEMPQMDGYEFTSTLRAQEAYKHIPIVMLTSRSGEKHRQKAFEVGATDYLVKPYQDEVLLNTVRRLVPQAQGVSAA
ncbi:MAG: response regulator [Candidatus Tectomicrobia bacterium]|uniref:histidine kinase n=1 Tax=Tectimicrobiota bacterium TaxID=2528274 RepID=A0A937W2B8_UNCTE|nr:response regulator [Candidatus Tectomicrobia bacterium]